MPRLARLDPATFRALAELAVDIRISTARTLTLVDRDPETVDRDRAALDGLGLITDPGSGWVGLTACAGEGACAKARYPVRAAAAARASEREPEAPLEHYAGCERICGRPAGATVVIEG
jgi:sulfite reductase beta subunit-like hemoprotein